LLSAHGSAYIYHFSFAARDHGGPKTQRIHAFLWALSAAAAAAPVDGKVLMMRETICDDALLHDMYALQIEELRDLKRTVDHRVVLSSGLLARLLPHSHSSTN